MCGLLLGWFCLSALVDPITCSPYVHDLLRLILARGYNSVHCLLLLLLLLLFLGMGGAYSAYGGEERRIQGFGGETCGKETIWKTQA